MAYIGQCLPWSIEVQFDRQVSPLRVNEAVLGLLMGLNMAIEECFEHGQFTAGRLTS